MTDRELKTAMAYIEAREAFLDKDHAEDHSGFNSPVLSYDRFWKWQARYLETLSVTDREYLRWLHSEASVPDSAQCAEGGPLLVWIARNAKEKA